MRKDRNWVRRFEYLESRLCLAVAVGGSGGDLAVEADADGAVEILALARGHLPDEGQRCGDRDNRRGHP